MKKSKLLRYLIHLIVLLVFNIFYFGIWGTQHPTSAWIAYGFIHFSYIMLIITPLITEKGKDYATYAQSMYAISSTYFIVEFVVGVVFIIWAPEGYKFSLFSQVAIVAIYLVILFSNMIADEHTAKAVEKHQAELIYVKESCSMLKSILEGIDDKHLYRQVEKVYDLISSSPVKSHSNVHSIESQIMSEINTLGYVVHSGDTTVIIASVNKILRLANERNRLLRLAN